MGTEKVAGRSLLGSDAGNVMQIIVTIILVVMAGALAYAIFLLSKQDAVVQALSNQGQTIEKRLGRVEKETESLSQEVRGRKDLINLTIPTVQRVDDKFYVAKLAAEPYSTGVKVRGVMINASSVEQINVKYRVAVADQSTDFVVDKMGAGSSRAFEVVIQNVTVDKAAAAQIKAIEASISYFKD